MVKQVQTMEVHGDAEIHLQSVEKTHAGAGCQVFGTIATDILSLPSYKPQTLSSIKPFVPPVRISSPPQGEEE
ncbi:hypothetical protein TURU_004244 [Turdus rufiventris]|nr:hypothetical protein TURU_004244 [Turdus rufiventris]